MAGNKLITEVFLSCQVIIARAVSRIVPPHDIEDIVQETYVRVCQYKSKGEIREPRTLMIKTAKNLALDHIKRAENRLNISLHDESVEPIENTNRHNEPCSSAVSDQEFGLFCEAVRQLPTQCRRVFVLKKVYGYSQQEVAKAQGISESTVEKHIAKGLKFCSQYMVEVNAPRQDADEGTKSITIKQGER